MYTLTGKAAQFFADTAPDSTPLSVLVTLNCIPVIDVVVLVSPDTVNDMLTVCAVRPVQLADCSFIVTLCHEPPM